ncbi:protein kinase family protein [Peterkaempfera bronchialis]|uniref:Aminoglycoside phosphotransferase domain-containing protein n=1 Tax=Peterkaempfera bronchialis TaxID=2126346 RepID=A0A345STB4_9ACTN|nr:hypothetical protein [Peterkaempfera bronchialis]AXI76969.1 hypothetical protein C7M71_005385 [Peterkaempfera bronchialis]
MTPLSTNNAAPDSLLAERFEQVRVACAAHTGPISHIAPCIGGNVSHVFRVHGPQGSVIVKLRGDRFAQIPELTTDPALIAVEHRALILFHQQLPTRFPTVLAFLPQQHALVMTDVFPDHRNWRDHLDRRPATPSETARLGRALAQVHHAAAQISEPLRPADGDDLFRAHTFDFCLRASGHPALDNACHALDQFPGHQLVLGDASPKNMSLAGDTVVFVDLDNVHRNAPLYDLGYLLAHLLLHHLARPRRVPALASVLLDAYSSTRLATTPWRRDQLLAAVAAGVLLYRIDAHVVPYPATAPPQDYHRLRARLLALLDSGPFTVPDLLHAVTDRNRR